jgi:hypothetical protein
MGGLVLISYAIRKKRILRSYCRIYLKLSMQDCREIAPP